MRRGAIAAVVTAALAALLVGCGDVKTDYTIAKQRAQSYLAAHPDVPPEIADAIRANTVRKGMNMEQVIAAWGQPAYVQRFRDGAVQYWYFGCDWPNYCNTAEKMSADADEIYNSRALFQNGVVVDWKT